MYNDFVNSITNKKQKTIIAYFEKGGKKFNAEYTTGIFELLKTEPSLYAIVDGETGEIIFEKEVVI